MVNAGLSVEGDALTLAIDRYLRGTTDDFDEFDFFGEQARAVNYAQLRRTDADALFGDAELERFDGAASAGDAGGGGFVSAFAAWRGLFGLLFARGGGV